MATVEQPPAADPVMAELARAIDDAVKGIREPKAQERAAERMDRVREEMRQRTGEVDIAVELLHETRDES